eukprot:CAMPEP_0181217566 /NCGR_PEP_ID=MMETSP1096-20121128/27221_1 /TAXON_ID=156174 ORGANISM="Chrysochromulina ericina, Strain CCMP281" /NCGR_SAMPLE_ID=MMETSP1096 /ASSEMBLY_ACC=CAM_ASM_000453 /LENGTH=337 /DNA_ID=CAMNT_0023309709 /DNA_START=328 /DNA_END=1341 /DNA_ORIENTATION=-
MHDESDRALRKLAFSTGCPRLYLNYEWLQEESGAHMVRRMLTTFLGIELPSGFSVTHDINESGTPAVLLPGAACDQQPPECNETADSGCDLHDGIGPLVSYSRMRFPMLAIGVHSDSGGAAFMAKVMAQACKVWLTPRLGIRCSFRDNYDACDSAQADLCFHGQARISTGRFSGRAYRFVHIVRDPLEVVTRSYLVSFPNTTVNTSSTSLAFEGHIRKLLVEDLNEMQVISESHKTDLNYLRLRLEDLTENTPTKNTSMGTLFQFLLDRPTPLVLPSSVQVALAAAMKIEERGSQSRRHLAKVLAKKKKKCVAISKCQSALGYFPNACQDPSAIASK